jgi:hypothetical protein
MVAVAVAMLVLILVSRVDAFCLMTPRACGSLLGDDIVLSANDTGGAVGVGINGNGDDGGCGGGDGDRVGLIKRRRFVVLLVTSLLTGNELSFADDGSGFCRGTSTGGDGAAADACVLVFVALLVVDLDWLTRFGRALILLALDTFFVDDTVVDVNDSFERLRVQRVVIS